MISSLLEKYNDIKAKREDGEGGFTLIELLVVVVIIGILIAIAIPLYLNYQKGAHDKSAQSDLRGAVSAVDQCYTDNNNAYPALTAVTGNANKGANLVFTCGTEADGTTPITETANVSDGTTLTYALSGSGFTLSATNDGGSGKTYNYNSNVGGKIN